MPCDCALLPARRHPGSSRAAVLRLLQLIGLMLGLLQLASAHASQPLTLHDPQQRLNLAPWLEYLEDPRGELQAAHLINTPQTWQQLHSRHANKGKNSSVWWFRFSIHLPDQQTQAMVLEPGYPLLDELQLWQWLPDGNVRLVRSGDRLPAELRPVQVRNPWLPLQLEPGLNRFLLRVDTTSTVNLPLHLASWPASAAHQERLMLFNGVFYGVVLGLFFYNLFLFLSLRESSYFWYLVYNLNMLLFVACFDGTLWLLASPGNSLQSTLIYVLMFSHCIVATQFSRHYLHTREQFPFLERLLLGKMLLVVLLLFSLPLIGFDSYNQLASLTVLFSSMVLLGSGLHVWRSGFRYGSFYTLAWGLLLISLMITTLNSLGMLIDLTAGSLWIKLGVCCELVLLSLGLADRIRTLREARQQADEQALQAQLERQAQNRFLARMSHEIRTPLNGVMGMLQLLRNTSLNEQQRHYLDTVDGSGKALLTVINDILDYARIESGQLQLEQIPFDPEVLVSESCGLFTAQAIDKGLDLHCWIDPELPASLQGDPTRIRQILLNLLSNAFKFTERGHICLHLSGMQDNRAGQWKLRFSVSDTGIGISPQASQQLFRSFVQADSSTTRRYGGSGLGLAICQELATIMGGSVSLQSNPGEGSTFTLELSLPALGGAPAIPASAPRVLLLAADPIAQASLAAQLQRIGCELLIGDPFAGEPSWQAADLVLLHCAGLPSEQLSQLCYRLSDTAQPALLLQYGQQRVPQPPASCQLLQLPVTPQQLRQTLHRLLQPQPASISPTAPPDSAVSGMRVLVAEDNPVNQLVIRGMLESLQCQYLLTGNGAEALACYRNDPQQWQLILMDCEMPVMDGYEAARMIRLAEQQQQLAATPIVALTAHVTDSHQQLVMQAGMQQMLSKPLQRELLQATLLYWKDHPLS